MAAAHQVSEFSFDFGAHRPIVGFPARIGLLLAGLGQGRFLAADLIVRPAGEVVQEARNGHGPHASANRAMPSPWAPRSMSAVSPAGQVTVSWSRSIVKSPLVNNPPGRGAGGWDRHPDSMP